MNVFPHKGKKSGAVGLSGSLLCAILAIDCDKAIADDQVTEGKYFSCLSAQWLTDFTSFVVNQDDANIRAYLDGNRCLLLKPNLPVIVTQDPGALGTTTAFTIQGIEFFAPSEEVVLRQTLPEL